MWSVGCRLGAGPEEAEELYKAKAKVNFGKPKFIRVLFTKSFNQLRATFHAYTDKYKKDICEVIRRKKEKKSYLAKFLE